MGFTFDYTLDITRKNRELLKGFLKTTTLQDLNKIPAGFNNNIIWNIAQSNLITICELLSTTIDCVAEDYKAGIFKDYNSYTVSTGSTLTTVEEAITFNNFHEGIHFGSILALRRAINLSKGIL